MIAIYSWRDDPGDVSHVTGLHIFDELVGIRDVVRRVSDGLDHDGRIPASYRAVVAPANAGIVELLGRAINVVAGKGPVVFARRTAIVDLIVGPRGAPATNAC